MREQTEYKLLEKLYQNTTFLAHEGLMHLQKQNKTKTKQNKTKNLLG